ncbi:MAG TPA: DUF2911 domain-containing protein [Terriglobales bacterium]|nr:DUF2911 domain-containing protein [Terriglobales bacterium]
MQNFTRRIFAVLILMVAGTCFIWAAGPDNLQEVTCAFEDGHGMRLQYAQQQYDVDNGHVWTPGNQAMALFLDTSVSIEGVTLPVGAYGLYVLPEKGHWQLIVNRTAAKATAYDSKNDVVRTTMGSSHLDHKVERPQLVLVHIAPTQCNIRLYADSTMAWEETNESK